MEHVRTYWINVQNAAIETRNLLINQVCGRIFETARTNALRAVALAEAQNLRDLASYRDTLALAEIRLGNVEAGVKEIKKGIEAWAGLKRGPEPRFLETLMSAAEAYLAKGNREQAQEVLDFVVAENYANAKTAERIAEMQQVLAAPADG